MIEPAQVDGPALIALGAKPGGDIGVAGDDHPPLPRGQLLVRVKSEAGEVAPGAYRPPLRVDGPKRLAGVLEDAESVPGGRRLQSRHCRRVAEDVNRQDARRALPDRRLNGGGIEVQRLGVDVAENRARALVEDAVGRGDEAERAGQHLVARAPLKRPHPEVERGRPAGDGQRVLDPQPGRNSRSKRSPIGPSESRPERSTSSTSSSSRAPISGRASGISSLSGNPPISAATLLAAGRPPHESALQLAGHAVRDGCLCKLCSSLRLKGILQRVDQGLPGSLDDVLRDSYRPPLALTV